MLIFAHLGDETAPVCANCSRLRRECRWGVKLSFHKSRMCYLTTAESNSLAEIEARRNLPDILEVSGLDLYVSMELHKGCIL